jgi:raffinose synthase
MDQATRSSSLDVALKDGTLDLQWDDRPLICQVGLVLSGEGWGSHAFRDCPPLLTRGEGVDANGRYQEALLLSQWQGREQDGMEARMSPAYKAGLRFRFYEDREVLSCSLLYSSQSPLAAQRAAKVVMPLLYGFDQGLSAWRNTSWWTSPQFVSSPRQISGPSQHLLWQRSDGHFGLLLPLGGNGAKASLGASGGEFGVELASFADGFRAEETPLFVLAVGANPYAMNEEAFELASVAMHGSFLPRKKKEYPEVFEGIGWCSWNTYYYDVDEAKLIASAKSFAKAGFPIRYMLIDDGWSMLRENPAQAINPDKPWPGTGRMLWDFSADPAKFPRGLSGAFAEIRKICAVAEFGVWHAFLGYWSYIHPDSPIGSRLKDSLMPSASGGLVPDPRGGKARAFYDAWYAYLKAEGVGFLKVDDQSSVQFAYKGRVPLQEAAAALEKGLQDASAPHFGAAVINCMAMSWENVNALDRGNISRCSNDFLPMVPDNGPQHLACNVYNSFWLSGASTPDFDMFESHHAEGENHALLRAVSGGPIYFTDKPGLEDWGLLRKLISADGRLFRADEPARPTLDMLFNDPLEKPVPLKSFSRAGGGGVVAAFNVFIGHEAIQGQVRAEDVVGMAAGPCVAYEHFSGKAILLAPGEAIQFKLENAGKQLYLFCPVEHGFAAIGLLDKFLSLKAIDRVDRHPDGVTLALREAGRLGFYSQRRVRAVDSAGTQLSFRHGESGWCEVEFPGPPQGPCCVDILF